MNDCSASPSSPWYRQFWPWFIIVLLSSAVLGSVASAYLAVHYPDQVLPHADQAG
ncbi:MAG: hypothetical protein WB646_08380 [Steroidobacteraceae bacterium]